MLRSAQRLARLSSLCPIARALPAIGQQDSSRRSAQRTTRARRWSPFGATGARCRDSALHCLGFGVHGHRGTQKQGNDNFYLTAKTNRLPVESKKTS
eukprot:7401294-Pyramimonas_sp.AAC.1